MNNLGIFTLADRERIADWVMHGNGRFYQRHEIQARIVRLLGSIASEVTELLTEKGNEDAASESTGNRGVVHTFAAPSLPGVRQDIHDH